MHADTSLSVARLHSEFLAFRFDLCNVQCAQNKMSNWFRSLCLIYRLDIAMNIMNAITLRNFTENQIKMSMA